MVKCLPEFEYFTVFLKKTNIIFKIRRSKVTDYAALKGTATLMMTMVYMKDLHKPCILIPVSSESVEKHRSCGHLNICKWTVMEAVIL